MPSENLIVGAKSTTDKSVKKKNTKRSDLHLE